MYILFKDNRIEDSAIKPCLIRL